MLLGWSFVGIKQATSPPMMFLPLRLCKSFLASSIENPLNAGSIFATAGATVESKQSKSNVTYIGLSSNYFKIISEHFSCPSFWNSFIVITWYPRS